MALKAKRLEEIIKILNIDKEKKTKTKKKNWVMGPWEVRKVVRSSEDDWGEAGEVEEIPV